MGEDELKHEGMTEANIISLGVSHPLETQAWGWRSCWRAREDCRLGAMVVDIYASPGKQNGQQRRQKWLPSTRRVTEGERGWGAAAAASRVDIGRSMGPGTRHGQHEARVAVNPAGRGLWHT